MEQRKTYNHILKYTGLFGLVQLIIIFLGIVRNKCIAIILGPSGTGLIDIYSRTADFVGNATNFGISISAVKNIAEQHSHGFSPEVASIVCTVRSWALMLAGLGTLTCIMLSPAFSFFSFKSYDYTLHFIGLAPMVGFLTLAGAELAVLKGIGRLKQLALLSLCSVLSTLIITCVFLFLWGRSGIIPILVLSAGVMFVLQLAGSQDLYPWRVNLRSRRFLYRGIKMIKLGLSFNLAAILTIGAEMAVRAYINDWGSLDDVGLYVAGFTLTVAYTRLVFVSADADYYPRLTKAKDDVRQMNEVINKQIDIYVLLMGPFLVFFVLTLPLLIPILYNDTYLPAIPISIAATFYMYFKAISTPIAYLALANGNTRMYLLVEATYCLAFVSLIILFYSMYGLVGTGIALSLSYLVYLVVVWTIYTKLYGFRMDRLTLKKVALQGLTVGLAVFLAAYFYEKEEWKYILGSALLLFSWIYSFRTLKRETDIISKIKARLKK